MAPKTGFTPMSRSARGGLITLRRERGATPRLVQRQLQRVARSPDIAVTFGGATRLSGALWATKVPALHAQGTSLHAMAFGQQDLSFHDRIDTIRTFFTGLLEQPEIMQVLAQPQAAAFLFGQRSATDLRIIMDPLIMFGDHAVPTTERSS